MFSYKEAHIKMITLIALLHVPVINNNIHGGMLVLWLSQIHTSLIILKLIIGSVR